MTRAAIFLAVVLAACSASSSADAEPTEQPTAEPTAAESVGPTPIPTPVAARGRFVYVPGSIDCPGGCPSYSIPAAIALPSESRHRIVVNGYLLIEPDGSGWYCETLTDSTPPHCAGDRLAFDGLDLMGQLAVEELTEELDGVRWSEGLQFLGGVTP